MSEIIKNKYLDFGGLKKYDELIKGLIASGNKKLADTIAALDAKLGSLEFEGSDDKSFAEAINEIYAAIAEVVEKQGSLDDKDSELEGKINSIIGGLESLEGSTLAEIKSKLSEHTAAIAQHTTDIAGVKERVTAVEEAIKNLGEIEGGESLGEIVSEVKANTAAIASLKGDAETVTAAVNKIAKDAADAAQAAAEATAAADATSKADAALAAAKEYAAGLAGNYDAAGTAAGLNAAMDTRMTGVEGDVAALKAIDHDKLVADAVAAVVAGAESDFDTLKEVADWIAADTTGSAELQATVSGHTESINTINSDIDALEAKVDEDIANLTNHMSDAATKIAEVDDRLEALEAFEETHSSIEVSDIEGLFAQA